MSDQDQRTRIEEHLAEILDGDAPAELYDLLASDDLLRDLRHDAEEAVGLIRHAGDDYVAPTNLEARVLAALDSSPATTPAEPASLGVAPTIETGARLVSDTRSDEPPSGAPTLHDASPIAPTLGDASPVAPTLGDASPIAPTLGDASPVAPTLGDASPIAPSTTAREPVVRAVTARQTELDGEEDEGPIADPLLDAAVVEPGTPNEKSGSDEKRSKVVSLGKRSQWWLRAGGVAAVGGLAAGVLALVLAKGKLPELNEGNSGWEGKVAQITRAGGEGSLYVCDSDGDNCETASSSDVVPKGSVLKTDATVRARLKLSDGTEMTLDRDTRIAFAARGRQAKLERGAIVADVAHDEENEARFEVPVGHIKVLGTKFGLRASDSSATVDVSRGKVRLEDPAERGVTVYAGEEGRLFRGQAPYAAATTLLGEALAWSDQVTDALEEDIPSRGLGELRAKKPGDKDERRGAVTLSTHQVKVRISGAVARTEVEEVFDNNTNEVLEGIYRFPLPPDAKIERLALEVDGKLEEGAFVDRDRAAAIWRGSIVNAAPQLRSQIQDEIVWVPGPWKDPALLEWQRGSRFELRIYPIPAKGSRRVILTYTQVIKPTGGVRRYTYPLAHDPSGSTRVGDFQVDLQVRGHDSGFAVTSRGYDANHSTKDRVHEVRIAKRNFAPAGDLVVEYALPNRNDELTAWAYQPDLPPTQDRDPNTKENEAAKGKASYPYVALALRPKLPRVQDDERRAYVFVVDSSRSMFGESYQRATRLTARMVRELDEQDRFTVLACDSICQHLPGGMQAPSRAQSRTVQSWLESVDPEGSSDPTAAVREAQSAASNEANRALRVVYVGDGTPTSGPIRPAYVSQAVRDALRDDRGTVTTVAVGADSDLDTLQAMARGGGGVVLPYIPGQSSAEAAYAALGMTYGHALRDVRVELPSGLVEVAPEKVDTIPAGGESVVVARMTQPQLEGTVVLRGKLGKKPFEQRYPVKLLASKNQGNAFVPRLYAATRIADLERRADAEAKQEAIQLSSDFDVASRYTSLLVLESPAMFKAFGLDNTRNAPDWTGEEETDATTATGAIDYAVAEEKVVGPSDVGGAGVSTGGMARTKKMPAMRRAPTSAPTSSMEPAPSQDAWNNWNPNESSPKGESADRDLQPPPAPPTLRSRRNWVPMRRVWERQGTVTADTTLPRAVSVSKIGEAEQAYETDPNRRGAVRELYVLYALSGDLIRAGELAAHWSQKDPMDPEALTARADLAAQRGERDQAIRILGSVVDVRPGDVKSQKRLARLHRWAGRPALGCRHSVAISQLRQNDAELLAEAVRCSRETGEQHLATEMLAASSNSVRRQAEALLKKSRTDTKLSGDLKLEAIWTGGGNDLDLALLHPDGHRVSWLGAPTRSVITATNVLSTSEEGLALRGARPGEYVIEVVRASGTGPVSGNVTVTVAGTKREVPFRLDGDRVAIGVVRITMHSRLVPVR